MYATPTSASRALRAATNAAIFIKPLMATPFIAFIRDPFSFIYFSNNHPNSQLYTQKRHLSSPNADSPLK